MGPHDLPRRQEQQHDRPRGARRHLGHPRPAPSCGSTSPRPLVVVVGALVHRRRLLAGAAGRRRRPARPAAGRLPQRRRPARRLAALGGLRGAGAIGVRPDRRLRHRRCRCRPGVTPLDHAIHHAAHQQARTPGDLRRDERVRAAPSTSCARAWSSAGLVIDARRRRGAAAARVDRCSPLLAVLGVLRIVAGLLNDRPVGYLSCCSVPVVLVGRAAAPGAPADPGRPTRRCATCAGSTPTSPRPRPRPTPPTARPARRWASPCSAPPRSGRWTRASPSRPRSSGRR